MSAVTPSNRHSSGIAVGQFGSGGKVLSPDQVMEYYKRRGLCHLCGKVRTHVKRYGLNMEPFTKEGESFEGWCLKCHTLEEVMEKPEVRLKLAERSKKKREGRFKRGNGPDGVASKCRSRDASDEHINEDGASTGHSPNSLKTTTTEDTSDSSATGPRTMEAIMSEMTECVDDSRVQKVGCAELSKLSNESTYKLSKAIDVIVSAMNKHNLNVDVQKKGCHAFFRFTTDDVDTVNAELCSKLVLKGGMYAVVSAMKCHQESPSVQREGMRVLRNILRANVRNSKLRVFKEREIGVVIDAMEIHSNSCSVQRIATHLLEVAASSRSNLKLLRGNPRVKVVLRAAAVSFPRDCKHSVAYVLSVIDGAAKSR